MKADTLSVNRKEIIGIDAMKAFFAVCVVAIHIHPYDVYTSIPYSVARFMDIILLCAVPFFFITTGFFIGKKLTDTFPDEKNTDILKYYLVKYLKLYLIWTAVYLPITLYYYIVISDLSTGRKIIDFFRGLIFIGEHWNSWMLWYLLSMIYALFLFIIIRLLKGNYGIVYIVSTVIFILCVVFNYYLNLVDTGLVMRGLRFLLGGSARLLTSPFYLSIGIIIGRAKKMTIKTSIEAGIPLTIVGFLIKMSKNDVWGGMYAEFSLAMCATGIFLLICMVENCFEGDGYIIVNSIMYKLRKFSTICYFTHLMIYTFICLFVWHEVKLGFDVFITVIIFVILIFIISDIKGKFA